MTITKILETTLVAGQSTVSFTDADIPNSLIRVFSTDRDMIPESIALVSNTLTVTYAPQLSNKGVALEMVKSGLDVIDNLTSDDTNNALSAKQGKVLKDSIDTLSATVEGLNIPEYITDLDDVVITDIEDGQVLAWDDVLQKFINVDQSGGSSLTVIHKNWTATSSSASGTVLTESATLDTGIYIITAHSPLSGSTSFLPCCMKINDALYTGCIQNIVAQYGLYFCILTLAQTSTVVFSSAGALSVTWDSQYLDRGGMDIIKIG